MDQQTTGQLIRALRLKLDMTQEELVLADAVLKVLDPSAFKGIDK